MPSSGMLRRVALVRTDVSEKNLREVLRSVLPLLVTANVVPSSPTLALMMEAIHSSQTSGLI
jgi:hypothetical protein